MDSTADGTMEVAALGRPFRLGMLYDCRNDTLVPGLTLWDNDDLKNHIQERLHAYNDFEIVASETTDGKSSVLKVNASLKASFCSGRVEVDGSANYLNDNKSSRNQARVTLKYKATTKIEELSMSHLGRGNVKHPYIFDQGLATHVVTAILYGAQAFFVFDCEVSEQEDHRDIHGHLKLTIQKIPDCTIDAKGSLKMEDKNKTRIDKFSCRFYGDFYVEKPPTTFQNAVAVYQSLPGLLTKNGENGVPMKVWLLPLTTLDSSAAKLVRQISVGLVQKSQSVLEDFSELEMRCNDALRTTTAQQFPQIGKKLKSFKEICSEFKLEFQQTLAKKLPSIRGGGEEEAELAEVLKKRHSSPFSSKHLNEWMDCKERELGIIKLITNKMTNTKIIASQSHLYEEEQVVCFVFTSLGKDEPYLSALSKYLEETTKTDLQDPHTHDVEKEQWYASKEVTDEMRKKAKLFSDFAEANEENENMKFLAVGLTNETQEGSSIYLYEDGFTVSENFEPPSKPETVTAADTNHNSVTLKISPPTFGAENITSYSVEYCVSGEGGWQQQTEAKAEEVTVRDLKPNTEYVFRCRAVTSAGVGPANEVSIKTLACDELTKDILRERKQLEISAQNLQVQVKLGLAKMEEIKEMSEKLKENEAEISRNENFEFEVTVSKPDQEDISGSGNYITNCQQCHVTCPYPNDAYKRRCIAMGSNGYCTECPGKCSWIVHFNQKYKWGYKDVKEKITIKELKEKYQVAKGEKMTFQEVVDKLKDEYTCLQAEVEKLMQRSAESLNRLKEIALKPNPLSTPEFINMLIEGEKSESKPGWKGRVQALIKMKEKAETMAKIEKGEKLLHHSGVM